eukprot:jgi/Psemu1/303405/fgenesh1_kg.104_\
MAAEKVKQIVLQHPQVVDDPVYVTALRNLQVDGMLMAGASQHGSQQVASSASGGGGGGGTGPLGSAAANSGPSNRGAPSNTNTNTNTPSSKKSRGTKRRQSGLAPGAKRKRQRSKKDLPADGSSNSNSNNNVVHTKSIVPSDSSGSLHSSAVLAKPPAAPVATEASPVGSNTLSNATSSVKPPLTGSMANADSQKNQQQQQQ